jgi:hypothetical protein
MHGSMGDGAAIPPISTLIRVCHQHRPPKLLWMSMSTNEVIVRMATDLQQHRFVLRHCDGESNVIADMLSRAHHITQQEYERLQQRHKNKLTASAAASSQGISDGCNSDSSWDANISALTTSFDGVASPVACSLLRRPKCIPCFALGVDPLHQCFVAV